MQYTRVFRNACAGMLTDIQFNSFENINFEEELRHLGRFGQLVIQLGTPEIFLPTFCGETIKPTIVNKAVCYPIFSTNATIRKKSAEDLFKTLGLARPFEDEVGKMHILRLDNHYYYGAKGLILSPLGHILFLTGRVYEPAKFDNRPTGYKVFISPLVSQQADDPMCKLLRGKVLSLYSDLNDLYCGTVNKYIPLEVSLLPKNYKIDKANPPRNPEHCSEDARALLLQNIDLIIQNLVFSPHDTD